MAYGEMNLQRKMEIENGLLDLMGEISYEDIMVKDLTEKLHMARKTFYHYFPNKRACLESLTDRLIYECNLKLLEALPRNFTSAQCYELRLQYWIEHRQFLEAVNRNRLGSFFLDRLLQYMHREDPAVQKQLSTETLESDEDILFFYMSGQVFLLLKWCYDGFRISMEEMVQKYLRLIHEPLIHPESTK